MNINTNVVECSPKNHKQVGWEEYERVSPRGDGQYVTEHTNLFVFSVTGYIMHILYTHEEKYDCYIFVVNYRPWSPPKSTLTVSNEHMKETRWVELRKLPRVFPEASHRQDEE